MGVVFANKQIIHRMQSLSDFDDHVLFEVPLNDAVDARVSDHTDLSLYLDDKIYVAPTIYEPFLIQMQKNGYVPYKVLYDNVVCGVQALSTEYPANIAYNAVKLKHHFFHKLSYTEPRILEGINCEKINVNQGYTRCATMVVTEGAVITEDEGLSRIYEAHGYDVLRIEKGHVLLPGYNYGFFGGTGGVVEDMLVLNGALKHHPNGDAIKHFVHRFGLKIIELHDDPVIDCGSILYLNTR